MANHEAELEESREAVDELRESIQKAVTALEELEGAISDMDSLDNVSLKWGGRDGQPYINNMINSIALLSAKFTYEFEENL